ncbi:EAL domain-containing protein [Orrella sp. JC864]|uniref:EAL domain-containing protein n=1 Tax=Orrella sp. JC864 TaxID=3120298 RepID=UPI003008D5B6
MGRLSGGAGVTEAAGVSSTGAAAGGLAQPAPGLQAPLKFIVTIENYTQLAQAYGEDFARGVVAALRVRARALGLAVRAGAVGDESRFVAVAAAAALGANRDVSAVLAQLGGMPVERAGRSVLAALRADTIEPRPLPAGAGAGGGAGISAERGPAERGRRAPALPRDAWRCAYLADMDQALRLYRHLAGGELLFAFQPVAARRAPSCPVYLEALLRAPASDGAVLSVGHAIGALERLGLMRHVDHCVVGAVLDLLGAHPGLVLGCNVSAASMADDGWWQPILRRLQADRALAGRLVLEITESTRIADPAAALAFVRRLQGLGCRVALDDFGAGFANLEFAVQARPDIIKIDIGYLRRARECEAARAMLANLIRLCASIADHVVVEGMETRQDLALLGDAPGLWLQGWWIGRPVPWLPGGGRAAVGMAGPGTVVFNG